MEVSNADRIVFPQNGITKGDVVGYYERVAERMLPHLAGRPLTLERYPKGIDAKGFMQKNAPAHFPESIHRVTIPARHGTTTYPVVDHAEHIPYLANQGTITFHVWTSRVPNLEHPDRIIFDLDPPEDEPDAARRAAESVRLLLDEVGLPSVPMATGSKGFHVVAPILPLIPGERIAAVSNGAALWLATKEPNALTLQFRKENRRGRVFVDWLRNRPGQTGVAAWSLRPKDGAPVAMPITWDELATTSPDAFALETVSDRLVTTDPLLELAGRPTDPTAPVEMLEAMLAANGIEPEPFDRFRS